ncbi:MAG: response regulator transcription factor [Balneolaceae bacterium]
MPNEKKSILIVEDEPSLIFTLQDTLESEGYDVHVVSDGDQTLHMVETHNPDLMLLDLMLPGKSGYEICKEVRENKHTFPIIMLTARDQEVDKVAGLNIGADDYLTKPFGVKELLARIQARLRRASSYSKSGPIENLTLGEVKIDLKEGEVYKPNDVSHDLSVREVEMIQYLVKNANQPVSRDELLEQVWRYEYSTNTRTVDVHVSKLRAKIELTPDDPKYLVTLHGVGYMLKLG